MTPGCYREDYEMYPVDIIYLKLTLQQYTTNLTKLLCNFMLCCLLSVWGSHLAFVNTNIRGGTRVLISIAH